MKPCFSIGLLLLLGCAGCNNQSDAVPASENEIDAARNFIRASLDRNWPEAKKFMLQDSSNVERLNSIERLYLHEDREERRGYREASITTYDTRKISDSATVVVYANSYKNKKDSLKVVRVDGEWLVDLKYTVLPIGSPR
ncbi:MAG TPA: hypothetical protein VFR58_15575 [Flavisolibacter sp.]|nr:hypothetical protein [Flavisolibacter sp.]